MTKEKPMIMALNKRIFKNIFYENTLFAFKEKPRDYGEYINTVLNIANDYSIDAVPIPEVLNNEFKTDLEFEKELEESVSILSKLEVSKTKTSLGLINTAPFTKTAIQFGITNFLAKIYQDPLITNKIISNTEKTKMIIDKFDGLVDFIILIDPLACNNIISPRYFEKFVFPSYLSLSKSSLPIVVHMPGKIKENLAYLSKSKIKAVQPIDVDDLETIIQKSNGLQIIGNFNKELLISGEYKDIEREFERCKKAHNYKPFIVHTDFWIPRKADPRKVRYLSDLIHS